MSPWINLLGYGSNCPTQATDASGLDGPIDAKLISAYWVDGQLNETALGYGAEKCSALMTAINQARYDMAHASAGLGYGQLPEVITELEKLYAIKCGKPAPPSAYPILPPPYQPGRACTESFDDARAAFEAQERAYERQQIVNRVEGWEFLGHWAEGVAWVCVATAVVLTAPVSVPLLVCASCGNDPAPSKTFTPGKGPGGGAMVGEEDDCSDKSKKARKKRILRWIKCQNVVLKEVWGSDDACNTLLKQGTDSAIDTTQQSIDGFFKTLEYCMANLPKLLRESGKQLEPSCDRYLCPEDFDD